MCEVVDLIASSVSLAASLIKLGIEICQATQGGLKELRVLALEATSLKGLLELVEPFISFSAVDSPENGMKGISTEIQRSKDIMQEIDQLLRDLKFEKPDKRKTASQKLCDAVRQLLKKSTIEEKVEELRRCRNWLKESLMYDTWGAVRKIAADVSQVKDSLEADVRSRILKELIVVDPSINHHEACRLHDPSTSDWIIRSNEWKTWISGGIQLWWIDGIPGAGKTVLASYLIEKVRGLAENRPSCSIQTTGWAYYYCYHARSHKSEDEPFLRWIVSSLAHQAAFVPNVIANRASHDLTTTNLWDAFLTLITHFERVFIIIDALDECQDWHTFSTRIQNICSLEKVSLLVTSREEVRISTVLEDISTRVSLSGPLHRVHPELQKDIGNHIRSELMSPIFKSWGEDLRQEVEHDLFQKAQGMFRWVTCQLEVLGSLRQASAVRHALANLPESLDETYERILSRIPPGNKKVARNSLALVCSMTMMNRERPQRAVLTEALRWTEAEDGNPDDQLLGVDAVLEYCICLLKTDVRGRVYLAHRTVIEYLEAPRTQRGDAADFYMSRDTMMTTLCAAMTYRLLSPPVSAITPEALQEVLARRDLPPVNPDLFWTIISALNFSCPDFLTFLHFVEKDKKLFDAVTQLLDSGNGHTSRISSIVDKTETDLAWIWNARRFWSFTPVIRSEPPFANGASAEIVIRLCTACAWDLFEGYIATFDETTRRSLLATKAVHPIFGDCTLADIATMHGLDGRKQSILQRCPELRFSSKIILYLCARPDPWGSGHVAARACFLDEIRALSAAALPRGHGVSPHNVPMTPLQFAILGKNDLLVSLLLAHDALPDGIADNPFRPSDVDPGSWFTPMNSRKSPVALLIDDVTTFGARKPLDICRFILREARVQGDKKKDPTLVRIETIERLLIQYGATASEPEGDIPVSLDDSLRSQLK